MTDFFLLSQSTMSTENVGTSFPWFGLAFWNKGYDIDYLEAGTLHLFSYCFGLSWIFHSKYA